MGCNYPWLKLAGWELSWVGVILAGNCQGGSYTWWEFFGWELSGWELSWVRIFFGGSFPGGKRPEGIIRVAISGWEFSRYQLY